MKRILLVGGSSADAQDNPALHDFTHYIKQVFPDKIKVFSTYIDKIVYDISTGGFGAFDGVSGIDISTVDAIYIRGPKMRLLSAHAYYLSKFCTSKNMPCINDYSLYYPGTKMAQSIIFAEHHAPFLRTIYAADKALLLQRAEIMLGYPYILKTNVGSHGDANYLIRNTNEARRVLTDEPDVDFLAQAFCPNDRDYRLLLMGKSQLVFERRGSADTHINNTSKGGEAMPAPESLPDDIIEKAREISQRLGLMVSGVDIMPHFDTKQLYFLEVNSQPQLRTGALLEEKRTTLRELFAELGLI